MTRAQLEHMIRAAGTIANVDDVVVIGSQAVLGEFPDAPAELLVSDETDVFSREHLELSDLIDSTIGEGSPFQRAFGYYAHGVDETTAILPQGWRDRLILVTAENTLLRSIPNPEASYRSEFKRISASHRKRKSALRAFCTSWWGRGFHT